MHEYKLSMCSKFSEIQVGFEIWEWKEVLPDIVCASKYTFAVRDTRLLGAHSCTLLFLMISVHFSRSRVHFLELSLRFQHFLNILTQPPIGFLVQEIT